MMYLNEIDIPTALLEYVKPKGVITTKSTLYGRPLSEFITRADGRIEWLCEHNVGHTVWAPKGLDLRHTCDNCCKILR